MDNPGWLQEYPDKEGYLRQKVLINFKQKFEFEIKDSRAGYLINVNDNC